jgi:hypothetical protein
MNKRTKKQKQMDLNDACLLIMNYTKESKSIVEDCKYSTCNACRDRCEYYYRHKISMDIIDLIQKSTSEGVKNEN